MNNRLEVDRGDLVAGLAHFRRANPRAKALLSFEGGFLSIEADDKTAVVRASGTWSGRARFGANILRALAGEPPSEDPVVFSLSDERLRISTMAIGCSWESTSAKFVQAATAPGYLDLLAMDRTLPRAEIHGTGLARKISTARSTLAGRVTKAAKLLEVAGINESELWALVEQKIQRRTETKGS
jgi:hypothetical protein